MSCCGAEIDAWPDPANAVNALDYFGAGQTHPVLHSHVDIASSDGGREVLDLESVGVDDDAAEPSEGESTAG